MIAERGLTVDHSTVYRWVQVYAPELEKRCRPHLKPTNDSWRVDETYILVKGKQKYLYPAVDCQGNTLDFLLTAKRDAPAAKKPFRKTLYSLSLRFLWKELPQFLHWLKPPHKKRDVIFGWAVSTLAVLVGAAPFLLMTFYSSRLIVESLNLRGLTNDLIVGKMFGGWYVTAVYLYHLRSYSNFNRRSSKARSH